MSAWTMKDSTETWQDVCDRAWAGEPQFISRDGAQTVVVLSIRSYNPPLPPKRHVILDAIRSCPCGDELSDLITDRPEDVPSYFERSGGFCEK